MQKRPTPKKSPDRAMPMKSIGAKPTAGKPGAMPEQSKRKAYAYGKNR